MANTSTSFVMALPAVVDCSLEVPPNWSSGVGTVAAVVAMATTLFYASFFNLITYMNHNRSVNDWGQALT